MVQGAKYTAVLSPMYDLQREYTGPYSAFIYKVLSLMQSSAVLSGGLEVGRKNADSAKAHSHQVTLYCPCPATEIFEKG